MEEPLRQQGIDPASYDLTEAIKGGWDPKRVEIPAGTELKAAAPADPKYIPKWGAFEELDMDWYYRGNQIAPGWREVTEPLPIYEYTIRVEEKTPAVMSRVADQSQNAKAPAPPRAPDEPPKFQYWNPAGLGKPEQGRLIGYINPDGSFEPL
ncbi:MAG: hypothetical protein ACREQ7_07415 [Candidatus Binatia bacterium]